MRFTPWIFHTLSYRVRHDRHLGGRAGGRRIKGRSADEIVYEFIHAWLEAVCNTGETQKANRLHYGCGKNSQRPKDHGSWTPLRFNTAKKNEAQNTTATSTTVGKDTTHTHTLIQLTLANHAKLLWGLCQNSNFALLPIMLSMRILHCTHLLNHSLIFFFFLLNYSHSDVHFFTNTRTRSFSLIHTVSFIHYHKSVAGIFTETHKRLYRIVWKTKKFHRWASLFSWKCLVGEKD